MPDNMIKMLENGRAITRGLSTIQRDRFRLSPSPDSDVSPITVDWSRWLGSDAVSTATISGTGISASVTDTSGAEVSLSIGGGSGYAEHSILTTTGFRKTITIEVGDGSWQKGYC